MADEVKVTKSNFDAEVVKSTVPVVADFWAEWCGPCKMIAPVLDELASEMQGKARFVKMNVDENPQVAGQFGIMSIPTLIVFKDGKAVAYYSTIAGSYGFQAGVQKYGYAMFLMNDAALQYLDKSDGWELGTGPSVVVVDQGAAAGLSTSTARDDVYAFIFSQTGLMAGLGLQGTKITKIEK